jgi:hypothetical protein
MTALYSSPRVPNNRYVLVYDNHSLRSTLNCVALLHSFSCLEGCCVDLKGVGRNSRARHRNEAVGEEC